VLSILHLSAKLKMPPRATTAVRVRGAAQPPVAIEDAPTFRPAGPRKAHFSVILCHRSMGTLLGLHLRLRRRLGWGWLDSPQGGPHVRGSSVLRARASTGARRSALWSAHRLVYGCALTALTVLPAPPPPLLSAVSVNPTSVVGGNSSTGTVLQEEIA